MLVSSQARQLGERYMWRQSIQKGTPLESPGAVPGEYTEVHGECHRNTEWCYLFQLAESAELTIEPGLGSSMIWRWRRTVPSKMGKSTNT